MIKTLALAAGFGMAALTLASPGASAAPLGVHPDVAGPASNGVEKVQWGYGYGYPGWRRRYYRPRYYGPRRFYGGNPYWRRRYYGGPRPFFAPGAYYRW